MNIRISDELALPLDIVTTRIAIYGTSGSGKTSFGRLLAEGVHAAGHRFCVIDLKNDWWGLKSSANGNSEGIPVVIFGGPKKDVALYPDAGAVVADTVCSIDQSCIIDLDDLSKGKQLVFLTAFLERLYDVNREPLLLFADEADRYAPQKSMSMEANISLGAAEDICRRGRKRGIGSMWITQRTAVLNKNVADICDLTVVFRTPGSRDLKELEDRVARIADKVNTAEVMRLAPGLEDGQAVFLSSHPKLSKFLPANARPVQLPLPWTYDSSATPGVGKRRAEPKVLAKTDLAKIEQRMAAQIDRAKEADPTALQRQVAELKKEVGARQAEIAKLRKSAELAKPTSVFTDDDRSLIQRAADRLADEVVPTIERMREKFDRGLTAILSDVHLMREVVAKARIIDNSQRNNANMQNNLHKRNAPPPSTTVAASADGFAPNPAQKRILDALAWWRSIGQEEVSTIQVGAIALIDATGGYFGNLVGPLSARGWVSRSGGRMSLLEAGFEHAAVPERIATLDDYHNMLRERVRRARSASGKTVAALDAVIARGGSEVRVDEIGAEVGIDHTGGYFGNVIGPLSTLGLVERRSGIVRPTEMLFPAGLS